MANDFNFTEGGYVPGLPFTFEFAPAEEEVPGIYVLAGTTNFFTSIWADANFMYAASPSAFSIVSPTHQILVDYYTTTHSGSRRESLDHDDVVDINITGG